ncbi:ABC-2 family transporter protein [Clostridium tepidiprofundi DSM 19306]|uniref:ABC-2 family transporter protein n=1 Tax=Clostridium tepidiprofundi DSM 19306 TaxID=1121338 RepID=A0A151B6X1_9CLOT|nr:lantibiotic immunity ABC transporter MutG family permease subunit [Clostridium tepidiprofundi]KYH35492.1 ABC-2 family transporter protein [Clostridium tepidiprofundi DSM 19306]
MFLIRTMISEWMKTKRTVFRYVVLLVPILFSMLILAYISVYKIDYTFQIKVYGTYFSTIGMGLTMMAGILTALNIIVEDSAGEFRRLLLVPLSRNTIYLGKLFMIILVTIVDMFVSVGVLLLGIKILYPTANIQYGVFLEGTFFTILGSLFLYGLYLIISINFGVGSTISLAVGGAVLGAILQTGMGDRVWQFVPWAWSGRIGTMPVYTLKGFSKFKNVNGNFLKSIFEKEMIKGIPIAIVSFLIICVIGVMWFKRWEGRKY